MGPVTTFGHILLVISFVWKTQALGGYTYLPITHPGELGAGALGGRPLCMAKATFTVTLAGMSCCPLASF